VRNPIARVRHGRALIGSAVMLTALLTASGIAEAQSAAGPVAQPADDSLTLHGLTLYGIVDIGLQYETHGAPFSDYFQASSADVVQKNSNNSQTGATSSNLSQSRVGLQGLEPLGAGDFYGIFRVETFFNPSSGDIGDALKSLVQNNGRSAATQTTNLDSSVAGQVFQQSYVGLSSATYGALTFGRQNTLFADAVAKYDPQGASQAFSLIGLSGTAAGGGDTEDRRLDNSLKYVGLYGPIHAGVEYKFNGASGSANTAVSVDGGIQYLGLSVDAYYIQVKDAVSASALSATQVTTLPAGFSINNSLAATISDNTTYAFAGLYNFGAFKVYGAYEHIQFANPTTPLAAGFDDIGGYKLAFVNNAAFPNDKILQVYWTGFKYTAGDKLDITLAYYGYSQNAYGAGKDVGCTSATLSGTCSGTETAVSLSADYRFTKRFDIYAGIMYTSVQGGLANGFDFSTSDSDPTIGFRFRF
jgi:predicted porin